MRRLSCRAGAVAITAGLFAVAASADAYAGWLTSGWSGFIDEDPTTSGIQTDGDLPGGYADGNVNFAVWQNDSGTWTGDFGFDASLVTYLSGTAADSAPYVYFYQIVNNNIVDPESFLEDFFLRIQSQGVVSSFGYIDRIVFNDAVEGAVGPSGNDELGPQADPDLGDEGGNGSATVQASSYIGDSTDPFASSSAAINPTEAFRLGNTFINFDWSDNKIDPGEFSSVFFVTGSGPPTLSTSQLTDTENTYNEVVSPTPVPASLALLLGGLPGFAGLGLMFCRRGETVVA